jgi:hypothetical protein
MNNGQNEIGSGGNGGAIYKDGGDGVNLTLCGDQLQNNTANQFGAGIFLTAIRAARAPGPRLPSRRRFAARAVPAR